MKSCISCGMPLNEPADFAQGDTSKDYCLYCARPDGSMKSYEEELEGMTNFIVSTQGLDANVARSAAQRAMAKLPAWQGHATAPVAD